MGSGDSRGVRQGPLMLRSRYSDGGPAILRRVLRPTGPAREDWTITVAPAATRYDEQTLIPAERSRSGEDQLLRDSTQAMLALPTSLGIATLSLARRTGGNTGHHR